MFVTGTSGGSGVAIDGQHIYWANYAAGTIGRADLDGSHVDQAFLSGASQPVGVAVDSQYIYWTNSVFSNEDNDFESTIGRARLDGSEANQRFIVATRGEGYTVDGLAVSDGFIYWADIAANQIGRARLDGTGVNDHFITGANSPDGVAANATFLFWSNSGDDSIGRALLDGTQVNQRCVVPSSSPIGNEPEAVATDGPYVYWSAYPEDAIGRANLDGTGVDSELLPTKGVPEGIAVEPQQSSKPASLLTCAPSPEPVLLGVKAADLGPFAAGWGQVAPATLSNGGASANGTISKISWSTWGEPIAEGQGLNPIYMPQGGYYPKPAVIQLRLSNIRRCTTGGPLSYTTLMTREQTVPDGPFGPWRTDDADLCHGEGI